MTTTEHKGILWNPVFPFFPPPPLHFKGDLPEDQFIKRLSNPISSSQGTPFDLLQTRQVEGNRDKCTAAAQARAPDLASGVCVQATTTTAEEEEEERQASRETWLQNMCPVRGSKLSEATYLRAVCLAPISTSQSPKMDITSLSCWALWLLHFYHVPLSVCLSVSLSLSLTLPRLPLTLPIAFLPGVIKYANDLRRARSGNCSHSDAAVRKHTGGVHNTACRRVFTPAAEHIRPPPPPRAPVTWWGGGERANRSLCPIHFHRPLFNAFVVYVCFSRRASSL